MSAQRPFNEMRDTGLLWLINRVVFHPRGFALALHFADGGEGGAHKECTGWSMLGDGSEPWSMGDPSPEDIAKYGAKTEDQLFAAVQALLSTP